MSDFDVQLRTHGSYNIAHQAVELLRDLTAWPTPLNYELSLHVVSDPKGPLASAVQELVEAGKLHSEDLGEELARRFLPRYRLQGEILDVGESFSRELGKLGASVRLAQGANTESRRAMAGASESVTSARSLEEVRSSLEIATETLKYANAQIDHFDKQLASSSAEIKRLKNMIERSRSAAMTDALTALPNRRAFDFAIEGACTEANSNNTSLILAMMDIDHFKRVNDTWGHQTGDQVIRYVGSFLKALGLAPRTAARFGGEEFAVIMPREGLHEAMRDLEDMRLTISRRTLKLRTTDQELGKVTLSFGVAEHIPGEPVASLIRRADDALYEAKRNGRNKIVASPRS